MHQDPSGFTPKALYSDAQGRVRRNIAPWAHCNTLLFPALCAFLWLGKQRFSCDRQTGCLCVSTHPPNSFRSDVDRKLPMFGQTFIDRRVVRLSHLFVRDDRRDEGSGNFFATNRTERHE